jgi:hypothetical protein
LPRPPTNDKDVFAAISDKKSKKNCRELLQKIDNVFFCRYLLQKIDNVFLSRSPTKDRQKFMPESNQESFDWCFSQWKVTRAGLGTNPGFLFSLIFHHATIKSEHSWHSQTRTENNEWWWLRPAWPYSPPACWTVSTRTRCTSSSACGQSANSKWDKIIHRKWSLRICWDNANYENRVL